MLKDIFGFAEHPGKTTYGLGHELTLTRNRDSAILSKGNAINNAKSKLMVLTGLFHIILHQSHNKLYYLTKFQVKSYRASICGEKCF